MFLTGVEVLVRMEAWLGGARRNHSGTKGLSVCLAAFTYNK